MFYSQFDFDFSVGFRLPQIQSQLLCFLKSPNQSCSRQVGFYIFILTYAYLFNIQAIILHPQMSVRLSGFYLIDYIKLCEFEENRWAEVCAASYTHFRIALSLGKKNKN